MNIAYYIDFTSDSEEVLVSLVSVRNDQGRNCEKDIIRLWWACCETIVSSFEGSLKTLLNKQLDSIDSNDPVSFLHSSLRRHDLF